MQLAAVSNRFADSNISPSEHISSYVSEQATIIAFRSKFSTE